MEKIITPEQFISMIESYYGKYKSDSSREFVLNYIINEIKPERLFDLFRYVSYVHRLRDGAPGISDIEYSNKLAIENNRGYNAKKTMESESTFKPPEPISDREYFDMMDRLSEEGTDLFKIITSKNIDEKQP